MGYVLALLGGIVAFGYYILASLVNRWDEDHERIKQLRKDVNDISKRLDEDEKELKRLGECTKDITDKNANLYINIRNDIAKIGMKIRRLEGKETQ
jgi:uncharacterized protein YaaN involved in tellurite resistance